MGFYSPYFYQREKKDNLASDMLDIVKEITNKQIWIWQYFDKERNHSAPFPCYKQSIAEYYAEQYLFGIFEQYASFEIELKWKVIKNEEYPNDFYIWDYTNSFGEYQFSIHFMRMVIK